MANSVISSRKVRIVANRDVPIAHRYEREMSSGCEYGSNGDEKSPSSFAYAPGFLTGVAGVECSGSAANSTFGA